MEANENNKEYLKTKKEYFGHLLDDEQKNKKRFEEFRSGFISIFELLKFNSTF